MPKTENQERLSSLSIDVRYANPKMAQLQTTLLNQFGESTSSRGIIFSKTRLSTNCLLDWVSNNPAMQKANIQAAILTGAGSGNNSMSQVCSVCYFLTIPIDYSSFRRTLAIIL